MSRLTADRKLVLPPEGIDADSFGALALAYAESILEARGFFEHLQDARIPLSVLDVAIPFELSKVGAQYTEDFAARRAGQRIANAIVDATAAFEGIERAELEKHLKLPLTRLRQLTMGKEAAPTVRFHQIAKLLAEQLFGTHEAYAFSGTKPLNRGIWKLIAGTREYTDYKPGMATWAGAAAGSLFATPVEYATLTEGGDRSAVGGARMTQAHATGGGFTLGEILLGMAPLVALTGGIGGIAGAVALGAIGAVYPATEIGRTRALHEIAHVIQFEILGSALNDHVITPEDFWQIMYDVKAKYAYGGGTEAAADIVAFQKVLGDVFAWFAVKSQSYFMRRSGSGDATALERLARFQQHLRNVQDILEQEGYGDTLRRASDLDDKKAKAHAAKLAEQERLLEERGHA